jgi:hypothetical protein
MMTDPALAACITVELERCRDAFAEAMRAAKEWRSA